MKTLGQLGLVAAALAVAACGPTVLTHGDGGGNGGTAGSTGAGGLAGGSGGGGGALPCDLEECFRPYECVRTCGGPIESSGCCPCEAPLFDNYENLACAPDASAAGGRGGSGGSVGGRRLTGKF